ITSDLGVSSSVVNPFDDSRFFIAQQYTDLTGHEPDQNTLDKLTAQLSGCGKRADCLRARRVEISTNLLLENELPGTGVFLYGLYSTGPGGPPRYMEFESDREVTRIALAAAFVERAEFKRKFPATMKPAE